VWTRAACEDDKAISPCVIERDTFYKRAALCPDAPREPRMPGLAGTVMYPAVLSWN